MADLRTGGNCLFAAGTDPLTALVSGAAPFAPTARSQRKYGASLGADSARRKGPARFPLREPGCLLMSLHQPSIWSPGRPWTMRVLTVARLPSVLLAVAWFTTLIVGNRVSLDAGSCVCLELI